MCCVLQYTLYGKTVKGKTNLKRENCTSCQSLSITPADTEMLCKKIDFVFEKVSKREQMQTKTLYNLLIYINADCKKDDFSRLRLYCTHAGTHLPCQHMFATYYR